jgi:hypothetical protein
MFGNHKNKSLGAFSLALLASVSSVAYTAAPLDTTFSLVAYAGGGYSAYTAVINPPGNVPSSIQRGGLSGSLRVMWHPDHLLRVGIESGWTRFFSYSISGPANASLSLSAVPLLLVFSMPISEQINIFAGAGGYFVSSRLVAATTVSVTEFSQGWMLAGSYVLPLSNSLSIAGELKWYNASQFRDAALSAQCLVVWEFLTW